MLTKHSVTGIRQRIIRFRLIVGLFFICLLIPLALIVYYGFQQFENEMYFQYRWKSSNALVQINITLSNRIENEQKRPASHYNFYQYVNNPLENSLTKELSPLANSNNYQEDIGLIGYFQINENGKLETPLLPYSTRKQIAAANTQLDWDEIERRISVKETLADILKKNNFLLSPGSSKVTKANKERVSSSENTNEQTKIESFQLSMPKNEELIFYRNVWNNKRHLIQGFIVKRKLFLNPLMVQHINLAHYENSTQVVLSGDINSYFQYHIDANGQSKVSEYNSPNPELEKQFLYHGHFLTPFHNLNLRFTTNQLPLGSASSFVFFFLIVLVLAIIAGCLGFYWLGLKQIALAEQRMNFVSSVSHELKTPLTSILMYSDMLKSGMVKDSAIQLEYNNFIFYESERLSRLINNILQLSSLSRNQEVINIEYINIFLLKDIIQSKTSSMIEKNSFQVNYIFDDALSKETKMGIDLDAFIQIMINLIDNAIKFYKAANIDDPDRRKIDICFSRDEKLNNKLKFRIRDYGPGISKSQHEKIFELFYREGREITRTTPGTGIGLALVNELVIAQDGQIRPKRRTQGVEFELVFERK